MGLPPSDVVSDTFLELLHTKQQRRRVLARRILDLRPLLRRQLDLEAGLDATVRMNPEGVITLAGESLRPFSCELMQQGNDGLLEVIDRKPRVHQGDQTLSVGGAGKDDAAMLGLELFRQHASEPEAFEGLAGRRPVRVDGAAAVAEMDAGCEGGLLKLANGERDAAFRAAGTCALG